MLVIKDENTMIWLFGDVLDDIKADLYSIQNTAYQSAVQSELYENIVNELNNFFVWKNYYLVVFCHCLLNCNLLHCLLRTGLLE